MKAEREAENRRFAEIGLNSESVAYRMACDRIIECLDALTAERERADRLVGIVKSLELFADEIMECHTGSIEGLDIEDLGLKFGLLRLLTPEEKRACRQGSNCNGCEDDDACFARADSFLEEAEK